jgi:hypothetical protein
MSMEILDREPDEPERLSDEQYEHAYVEYLEGLILGDIEQLRWAGNIIGQSDFPLARTVAVDVVLLENRLLEGDDEQASKVSNFTFSDWLQSYVYSGLAAKPELVRMAADYYGKDDAWLRRMVYPSETVLSSVGAVEESRRELRYYGLRMIYRLGLGSLGSRVAMRLGIYG